MPFDPRLDQTAHRLWPLPEGPWIMTQSWHDLLFAHWRVDHRVLRPKVPAAFDLNTYDGSAWIGVVPFTMSNVAPRGAPSLPWLSSFPELNVRTYVSARDGKPGVYFFSLDAGRWAAVLAARAAFNLPYYAAAMRVTKHVDHIKYHSRRVRGDATLSLWYEPIAPPVTATRGSLEYFLTERYCLYHIDPLGRPSRLEIHHAPWNLQVAQASIRVNSMTEPIGVPLEGEPLLHFAKHQDVVAWWPERLRI